MADPILTGFKVDIAYSADDGYRMKVGFASGIKTAKTPATPAQTIQHATRELARFAALFGHEKEFQAAAADGIKAVQDWRAERAARDTTKGAPDA